MYRQALKYLVGFAFLVTLFAATTAWSSNSDNPQGADTPYLENLTPLEYVAIGEVESGAIDSSANIIMDSCGVLRPVMERLLSVRSGAEGVVSILHIGDSHVQAGYWTARVRELLQGEFGNSGRGLIVPYKLAEGNEPRNYAIRTTLPYGYNKTTANLSGEPIGFTGVGVTFEGEQAQFEIWSKQSFNAVTVFHHPSAPRLEIPAGVDIGSYCTMDNTPSSTHLVLSRSVDTLQLYGRATEAFDNPTFYGFSLENGESGVLYHAIGSNGAAFEHFATHTTLPLGGVSALNPDLIIISLGTNNCYGKYYDTERLRRVIQKFVTKIQESYPTSAILLTTPRESGQRVRRGVYRPNPNVADAGKIITETARKAGVAYWDMYAAAGGEGVSEVWYERKLASTDRIHLTESGYVLLGDLLYNAFADHYNRWLDSSFVADSAENAHKEEGAQ